MDGYNNSSAGNLVSLVTCREGLLSGNLNHRSRTDHFLAVNIVG
ncbi:MAG TPA: hypothetical protein VMV56_10850 [Williamwhitmania sp.]|nr:hypothetical protein [Williamwhitmania sp.]